MQGRAHAGSPPARVLGRSSRARCGLPRSSLRAAPPTTRERDEAVRPYLSGSSPSWLCSRLELAPAYMKAGCCGVLGPGPSAALDKADHRVRGRPVHAARRTPGHEGVRARTGCRRVKHGSAGRCKGWWYRHRVGGAVRRSRTRGADAGPVTSPWWWGAPGVGARWCWGASAVGARCCLGLMLSRPCVVGPPPQSTSERQLASAGTASTVLRTVRTAPSATSRVTSTGFHPGRAFRA